MSLHYTKSGSLDMRYSSSKAAVGSSYSSNGYSTDYHYTKSGELDMRFTSSKAAVGSPSVSAAIHQPPNHQPLLSSQSSTTSQPSTSETTKPTSSAELHVTKDGKLDMRYDSSRRVALEQHKQTKAEPPTTIILKMDGNVSKTCQAYKQGGIILKKDGSVDKRSSLYKQGYIEITEGGKVEGKSRVEITTTGPIRNTASQRKFRTMSDSTQKDKKEVSHIIDLECVIAFHRAGKYGKNKPGLKVSEEQLKKSFEVLNSAINYSMRLKETNRSIDRDYAKKIISLYNGGNVKITRGLMDKLNQMKKVFEKIPPDKMNPDLKLIIENFKAFFQKITEQYSSVVKKESITTFGLSHTVTVNPSFEPVKRKVEVQKYTIYVCNIPYSWKEEDLRKAFEFYNPISVCIAREEGKSRGFGFVNFDSKQTQLRCVSEMNQKVIGGRTLKVELKKQREN